MKKLEQINPSSLNSSNGRLSGGFSDTIGGGGQLVAGGKNKGCQTNAHCTNAGCTNTCTNESCK